MTERRCRHMVANLHQARDEQQREFQDLQVSDTEAWHCLPATHPQRELGRLFAEQAPASAQGAWRPADRLAFEQREASLMQDVLRRREKVAGKHAAKDE